MKNLVLKVSTGENYLNPSILLTSASGAISAFLEEIGGAVMSGKTIVEKGWDMNYQWALFSEDVSDPGGCGIHMFENVKSETVFIIDTRLSNGITVVESSNYEDVKTRLYPSDQWNTEVIEESFEARITRHEHLNEDRAVVIIEIK